MATSTLISGVTVYQDTTVQDTRGRYKKIGASFRINRRRVAVYQCGCGDVRIERIDRNENDRKYICGNCDRMPHASKTHKREYSTWSHMRERCNPKSIVKSYKFYRENGIQVCQRWRESFENFYEDMGDRPDGCSLDRIDTYGNYSCGKCEECLAKGWPSNCRWATQKEQNLNKTNGTKLKFLGEEKSVTEWGDDPRVPVERAVISDRLRHGWSVDDALTIPWIPRKDRRKCRKLPSSA